jgi:hypothetical protein
MLVQGLRQLLSAAPGAAAGGAAAAFLANPIFTSLARNAKSKPQYLSAQQFSSILLGLINPPSAANANAGPALFAAIQANATAIGLGPQVSAILAKANGDYTTFVKGVEDWYDDYMDRVSGWYKAHSQRVVLAIGLVLAVLWNVDSFRIVRALSCNAAIRTSALQLSATAATATNTAFVGSVLDAIPLGWDFRWGSNGLPERELSCDALTSGNSTTSGNSALSAPDQVKSSLGWWILKIAGLLVTTIALSLGAPFWFDTLSNLTRVRQAGKKPDSTNPNSAS